MNSELAEALAEIDDPETVQKVVQSVKNPTAPDGESRSHADLPLLDELYERFLSRRRDRAPSTRVQYKRTIPDFIDFAEDNAIETTGGLSTDLVDRYVDSLQEQYDSDSTIITYTKNVRTWLRWLNKRGLCGEPVYRILDKDELGLTPEARDEALPAPEATKILDNLRKQRRGSLMHALLELAWNSGMRIGGLNSLDLRDFDPSNNEIRLRHRPKTGTRLKNGNEENGVGNGERNIELRDCVITALEEYIKGERPNVTDDYGREPLFATQHGRAAKSTLRRKIYAATSCRWTTAELEDQDCAGNCHPDTNVCPYSYYPHAIRRGAIVHHLSGGLRPDLASERFNVSIQTIKKHYDPRTKRKRKEDRSDAVRNAWSS
ncbi:tyrosine-type recombinase/integrase [Halorussus lipolyticus]|uniref:tyrosine-type recombinase/integrase n=1 Tax=Halorussus lipolyticus TaxID=3034024 RepID=UPI0023E79E25|nr:tyrosine-type recombinase/integrase [Halorussus sp. DT80]